MLLVISQFGYAYELATSGANRITLSGSNRTIDRALSVVYYCEGVSMGLVVAIVAVPSYTIVSYTETISV